MINSKLIASIVTSVAVLSIAQSAQAQWHVPTIELDYETTLKACDAANRANARGISYAAQTKAQGHNEMHVDAMMKAIKKTCPKVY